MSLTKEYGLVLTGGGGKGAYQIGAWKALDELGITPRIKAVAGTSVGALNALMLCQSDYKTAEETWLNVDQDDMLFTDDLTKREIVNKEFENMYEQTELSEKPDLMRFIVTLSILLPSSIPVIEICSPFLKLFCRKCNFDLDWTKSISELIRYSIVKGGAFTQEGLAKIIDDLLMITQNFSKIPCFVTLSKAGDIDTFLEKSNEEYFNLINKTPMEVREIVLASAALPLVYPKRKIGTSKYYDGGWGDNVPIKPLYDSGLKDIIVIYLQNNKHGKLKKQFKEEENLFPGCNIIRIIPNNSFSDGIFDTITVSRELTQSRIKIGYNDTISQLKKYMQTV